MKQLLVTGGLGLVGSASIDFFIQRDWAITSIDNNQRSKMFGVPREVHHGWNIDIRDEGALEKVFQTTKFDAIIHAAAQPSHDYAKDHVMEDFDINARATVLLLEATRKYCPNATFVHVSTDKVYGENMRGNTPFDESLGLDFAGKRSLFGCSKAAADMYVQEYGNYFDMKTACFRPGCITGKNHKGAELHGFLSYLVKCVKENKEYTIFGDGQTVRDQIHVYDLVNAFWYFIQEPTAGAVYNIGGGPERAISIKGALSKVTAKLGKAAFIDYGPKRLGDRDWDVHDVSNFKADYPEWDYKYSLEDIINDLCA